MSWGDMVGCVGDGFMICWDCANKAEPTILDDIPDNYGSSTHVEVINPDYEPYYEHQASESLSNAMYEATHYSGPRHGDWRVNFDSCDVCHQPLLGWGEIEEAQKDVDGTHWKHDRLQLIETIQNRWREDEIAAWAVWQNGWPTTGKRNRYEQYQRIIDKAHESLLDAPSWW